MTESTLSKNGSCVARIKASTVIQPLGEVQSTEKQICGNERYIYCFIKHKICTFYVAQSIKMTRHERHFVTIFVVVIIPILWEHKRETETRKGIELKNEEIIMIIKAK